MQGGYEVLAGDGGTEPGTGQADATRWLEDFVALKSERNGYRLLYGSPDIAALVHDGQESVLTSAAAANRLVPITSALPLLVLPTGGLADARHGCRRRGLEPTAIVLSDSSAAATAPLLDRTGRHADRQLQLDAAPSGGPGSRSPRHRRPGAAAQRGRDLDRGQHRRLRRIGPRPRTRDHHRRARPGPRPPRSPCPG